jgi:1,2-diacylglycerol 3-alpha-glucosyltransferase
VRIPSQISKEQDDPQPLTEGGLRIGLFSESFRPVQNGVTTSLLTLIDGLRTRRHRVWVFAPENELQTEPEINVLRFPSFVTSLNPGYPLAYPFLPRLALASQFSRLRLDVVHTHTPFVLGLTGANLALSRGVPLVTTFHTFYSQYSHYVPLFPDSMTQNLLDVYLPWYYNRCAAILCPSQVAAEALRQMGVESPIEVVPTGITLPRPDYRTEQARAETKKSIGLSAETPLLLFAGRLAQEKNLSWLLSTLTRVLQAVPHAKLALAGDGAFREELEAETERLKITDSVLFLGPLSRKQLDPLLAAADVFCFPSPSETQGLVIGEARAAGTPTVAIDAGGAPETITEGEDGFRVPEGDCDLFTQRIVELLCNAPLRERMRSNALKNAQGFVPERMIDRVVDVYARVRRQNPPTGLARMRLFNGDFDWENFGQSIREKLSGSPRA